MQKAIIYITSNLTKKVNDLIYFNCRFSPLIKTAFFHLLDVKKVYLEKKSREKTHTTSFKHLTAYLKRHTEIENIILCDDEKVIFNEEDFISLLELERRVYLVGHKETKVITVGEYGKDFAKKITI